MSDLTARTGTDPDSGVDVASLRDLERWLVERVAFYLEVPEASVHPDTALVELGLDSVYAMTLSGDIEERFDLELEPTIAWDHGTVRKLSTFLQAELGKR